MLRKVTWYLPQWPQWLTNAARHELQWVNQINTIYFTRAQQAINNAARQVFMAVIDQDHDALEKAKSDWESVCHQLIQSRK